MMKIVDYTKFLSRRSARRQPSAVRELHPLLATPGMISLGAGSPNPTWFPIDGMTLNLKGKEGSNIKIPTDLLERGLQYSSSYGLPELIGWLKEHQEQEHHISKVYPSKADWNIVVTTGSQDGLAKSFDMLLNEGDYILTENPTYSGSIAALQAIGANLVGVKTDADGMDPNSLDSILSSWDFKEKPLRVLYSIPTGQNPSGSTLSLDRKKKIMDICSKYDILILEDDPYYNLRLPKYGQSDDTIEPLPSFMSMDTDGRVLRFDSLSKVISSGLRVGWVTGPSFLIEKIQLDQQATVLHPSGLSQVVMYTILKELGRDGWDEQMKNVRMTYQKRRDFIVGCAEKYLTGLAEWSPPAAGMFLWLKLLGVEDTTDLIKKKAVAEKVLMIPGKSFLPSPDKSPYVRASFSVATFEEMEVAIQRLATLLKKERHLV
eukprot:TRINITY_DN5602_c1_g2_i1.p1 TRINITY_DN5602_c1_g2~~TRINITY_DN5602_c1_g2_i1.p1  ORF type:complete len:432 (-),score=141.26 TRINITY_DN5602_c1_g2_i1:38-1333(-)